MHCGGVLILACLAPSGFCARLKLHHSQQGSIAAETNRSLAEFNAVLQGPGPMTALSTDCQAGMEFIKTKQFEAMGDDESPLPYDAKRCRNDLEGVECIATFQSLSSGSEEEHKQCMPSKCTLEDVMEFERMLRARLADFTNVKSLMCESASMAGLSMDCQDGMDFIKTKQSELIGKDGSPLPYDAKRCRNDFEGLECTAHFEHVSSGSKEEHKQCLPSKCTHDDIREFERILRVQRAGHAIDVLCEPFPMAGLSMDCQDGIDFMKSKQIDLMGEDKIPLPYDATLCRNDFQGRECTLKHQGERGWKQCMPRKCIDADVTEIQRMLKENNATAQLTCEAFE